MDEQVGSYEWLSKYSKNHQFCLKVSEDSIETLKLFIEYDVHKHPNNRRALAKLINFKPSLDKIELLLKEDIYENRVKSEAITRTCLMKDINLLQLLINYGARSTNGRDIQFLCHANEVEMVRLIVPHYSLDRLYSLGKVDPVMYNVLGPMTTRQKSARK